MATDEGLRKLAAILAADVAGYSRLMADDDRATVRALTAYRTVFAEHIEAHQGRVVDTAGDSILATFDSVVEAVEAAVEVQHALAECNKQLPDHRRMHFRIGVNLGDIIVRDDGTIYGDGVNVAARLESLAEPSGICISEPIYTAVGRKLPLRYESIGKQQAKNIEQPVHAYRVMLGGSDDEATSSTASTLTVLIADDHPLLREALKNVLKELDEQVVIVEAPDCSSALSRAEEHPDLDLFLTDLELPGIGGFAMITEMRKRYPATPVVVLSGHEDRNNVLEALERGAVGFIPKSSPNQVMLSALRLVLSGGQYLPPQVLAPSLALDPSGEGANIRSKVARSTADLGLTERQQQVLAVLMQGKSNKHICRELGVAERTVKIHVSAILRALNVTNRTQAVIAVKRLGLKLVPPGDPSGAP